MKLVREIVDKIDDETKGSRQYIEMANKYKTEYPKVAEVYYELSMTELGHVDKLHNLVVGLINEMKIKGQEVEPKMQFTYDYLHQKAIDKVAEVKVMQEMYKK